MQDILHRAGHKYLKLLFVLALAGSSALFFIGPAIPKPPAVVVVIVGGVLGLALEWSYFTFSCDLTEAISEGNKAGIAVNAFYTLAGGAASWFLFTNAALHVGWAPTDDLLGLARQTWAMVMAGLIVVVIFVLSARRKRSTNQADLQAMGRAVTIMLPTADDATRLQLLSTIAKAASESQEQKALPPGKVVEGTVVRQQGLLERGWKTLFGSKEVQMRATSATKDEEQRERDVPVPQQGVLPAATEPEAPTSLPTPSSPAPELLPLLEQAIDALTVSPELSDEELAEILGLKQAASARYWRFKAHQAMLSRLERADTTQLDAPGEAGDQRIQEYPIPLPGIRSELPGTNHHNQGDHSGTFQQAGGEGGSQHRDSPFRNN